MHHLVDLLSKTADHRVKLECENLDKLGESLEAMECEDNSYWKLKTFKKNFRKETVWTEDLRKNWNNSDHIIKINWDA